MTISSPQSLAIQIYHKENRCFTISMIPYKPNIVNSGIYGSQDWPVYTYTYSMQSIS